VFRAATVFLLVAVLLACPYSCLVRAAVSLADPATEEPCEADDGCCGSPGSESGKDHTGTPASCPQVGTCLCHGAVIERHVAPPQPDCEIETLLPHDVVLAIGDAAAGERSCAAEPAACHFAAADSGRAVRALIASLLL
jgi:hypothetical protein